MSPFELCEAEYCRRHPTSAFWKEVLYYSRHGVVHATPDYFVMGRRIPHDAPVHVLDNLAYIFPKEDCNAWHLAWFAGDMSKIWAADIEWLEYVVFQRMRDGALELQRVKTEVMARLTIPSHGQFS